jgi:CRP/FNR family transcriptional regulator
MPYNPVMYADMRSVLRRIPLFSSLNESHLERLCALATTRSVHMTSFLTHAGELWPYLFLVVQGRLSLLKESSEGRSLVVAEIGPDELFWGPAFFEDGLVNPVSIQALQESTHYLWKREDILPLIKEHGSLAWELSRMMVRRMLRASEVIDGLAFQPVAGRLASLLMKYPGQSGSGPTSRSLTLDDMAARIGSTREMVCRFLQKFADDGLIKITRTEFEIADRDRLASIAQKEKA